MGRCAGWAGRAVAAGILLAAGCLTQATAATYRVGSCEVAPAPYATITAALTAAQGAAGPHEVRVCPGAYANVLAISHANHVGLTLVSTTGVAADVQISLYNAGSPLVTVGQPNVTLRSVKIENTSNSVALQVTSTASGFLLDSAIISSTNGNGMELRGANPRLTSVTASTGGNYVGAVYLNGATGLVMDGASRLTASGVYGYGLSDSNAVNANPTLSGLTVSGGYGIYLRKAGAVSLSNSSITGTYAAAAYLYGGSGDHVFSNLTLNSPGHGLTLNGGSSATLTDVNATSTGSSYYNAALSIVGITGATSISATAPATARYSATGATNYGINYCAGDDSTTLSLNRAVITSHNHGVAAFSSGCGKPTVNLTNVSVESTAGHGIYVQSGRSAHNLADITGIAAQHGIYLNGGSSPTLSNLTLTSGNDGSSAGMAGLYLVNISSANLTGSNLITGRATGNYGIRLVNCDSCSISNASINMNGLSASHGIHLDSDSERVSISGNTVRNAPASGIHARSNRPTVHSNVVENSGTDNLVRTGGIALNDNGSAYNNCLYNAVSRNGNSAGGAFYISGTGNFWGSWPTGGGYSDSCPDANSDGLCDSAYTYSGSYQDRYPLTRCAITEPVNPGAGSCAYVPSYNDGNLHIIDTGTDLRRTGTSAISLGGTSYSAYAVAVKSDGRRAYASVNSKNTFSVADITVNRLLKNYGVGGPAHAIAINPAGTRLYVTRKDSKTYLRVYDASSFKLTKGVTLTSTAYTPAGLAVSPNGATVWVHNGRVSKINASNNSLISSLAVSGAPGGLAVSPDNATVYAVKQNGDGSDGIHVITAASNALARTINFGFADGAPKGIVLSPDGSVAWVALSGRRSLMKVTLASGAFQEIALSGLGAPAGADITPDGGKIYVGSSTGSNMAVVNAATLAVSTIGLVNKPAAYGRFIGPCPGSAEPPPTPSGFNAYETDTAAGAVTGVIKTKVAGTAFQLDLAALRSDAGSINTSFTGDVKVELVDASAGACADRSRIGASATLTWAAGDLGRKRATFTEDDAWPNVAVRMLWPASGTASITACSTDAFAIRPASFTLVAGDDDWTTAGTARSLNNTAANGGAVHKAGQPFSLTVTARNSAGAVTGNYQGAPDVALEGYVLPDACSTCALDAGEFSGSGTLTSTTASYSDVGVISLKASDASFASVDAADSDDAEMTIESAAVSVGRFVPDHFDVTPNTPAFMPGCGVFTYLGQPFTLATAPILTVTAKNSAGNPTENYTGSLWKLTAGGLNPVWSAAAGAVTSVDVALPAPTLADDGGGSGTVTFGVGAGLRLQRSGLTAPFNASLNLSATLTDADGVSFDGNPYTLSGIGFVAGQSQIRFGRLRLANANGSERLALPVAATAQYWTGQGFAMNLADACTALPPPALTFFDQTADNRLASGETSATYNATLIAGNAGLRLSAPGAGNSGYVDVGFTAPEWLRYNWDGIDQVGDASGLYDDPPRARASFGKRKGRDRIIIRRELY